MSDNLVALRLFVRIARTGSFSVAGRELGIPQPSTSRLIAGLERSIGAALITRTTRTVLLTETGAEYLARVEPILAALEEANLSARGTGELRGTLRIGGSSSTLTRKIVRLIPAFTERHPGLRIELAMDLKWQDLVREGVDLELRMGDLPDSTSTARRITALDRLLVASPSYLAKAGCPKTPAELANHFTVLGPGCVESRGWALEREGRKISVRVDGRVVSSVDEGVTAAAVAGLGIACRNAWSVEKEIESGALVEVLTDWRMAPEEFYAVFPAGRAAKPSARGFAAFLIDRLSTAELVAPQMRACHEGLSQTLSAAVAT